MTYACVYDDWWRNYRSVDSLVYCRLVRWTLGQKGVEVKSVPLQQPWLSPCRPLYPRCGLETKREMFKNLHKIVCSSFCVP